MLLTLNLCIFMFSLYFSLLPFSSLLSHFSLRTDCGGLCCTRHFPSTFSCSFVWCVFAKTSRAGLMGSLLALVRFDYVLLFLSVVGVLNDVLLIQCWFAYTSTDLSMIYIPLLVYRICFVVSTCNDWVFNCMREFYILVYCFVYKVYDLFMCWNNMFWILIRMFQYQINMF